MNRDMDFAKSNIITKDELLRILNCSEITLYKMCKAGIIKKHKFGHTILFLRDEVEEAIRNLPSD